MLCIIPRSVYILGGILTIYIEELYLVVYGVLYVWVGWDVD